MWAWRRSVGQLRFAQVVVHQRSLHWHALCSSVKCLFFAEASFSVLPSVLRFCSRSLFLWGSPASNYSSLPFLFTSSIHLFCSVSFIISSFLTAFEIFLPMFSLVLMFFHPHPPCWFAIGCGVLCGVMCHQPVLWRPACSWRLSLVSGFGLCPTRPSSPWQVAQEHFLGRYRPPHVCPHPPPENPGVVYFFSLAQ